MPRRPRDNSVFDEPHLRHGGADAGNDQPRNSDRAYRSVWNEPGLSADLTGPRPADADDYGGWLQRGRAASNPAASWLLTFVLAVIAGPLAIVAALWGSGQTAWGVLALVVLGPTVEEVVKVMAPLVAVEKRPFLFRSAAQIIVCAMTSGLAFAVIENLLYLHVYVADPSPQLVAWRWTVCVALHVGCSTVAGMAVARIWRDAWRRLAPPRIEAGFPILAAAIAIHGSYNLLAILIETILHPF